MKKAFVFLLFAASVFSLQAQAEQILWIVDNLVQIDGNDVEVIGDPQVIETEIGFVVEFDGIDDGLIVANNPLSGATEFTVEIIFKPYAGGGVEQRFLHMQQDDENRILIELRNPADENWSLDTFIKSGGSSLALLDYSFVHDLDVWSHAALIYKDGQMEHYVDGQKELEGMVTYQEVSSGQTSLGVRLNQVSWFKGAIHSVRITHEALPVEEFMEISMVSAIDEIEKEASGLQVFPNPLQDESKIEYQLTKASKVSVQLLDVRGIVLDTLFDGEQKQGVHQLKMDGTELESGIYFILLETDQIRQLKKVVILD
ncbi:MAG: T9SS type A sorting domain-containing protein [Bacteroidetes bacterium]|nr:T9SS type A sorting domain-containing protein [Bacteroidota bacterium]